GQDTESGHAGLESPIAGTAAASGHVSRPDVSVAPEIRVLDDPEELARESADMFLWLGGQALGRTGRFRVCLTGGSTPRRLYETIASSASTGLDWRRCEFYFGDERCVPPDDPASNFGMASTKLLGPLKIPDADIRRMPGAL